MKQCHLKQHDLVGKGLHRAVYRHPLEPHKCIKVVVHEGGHQEKSRETSYYELLWRRNVSFKHLSMYHGEVQTNFGDGSIFELIIDDDGQVSKTLQQTLQNSDLDKVDNLVTHLEKLYLYMMQHKIISMTLQAKNICYQKRGRNSRLVLVDSVGNSDFIPLCNYASYFAQKKLRRRWRRFIKRLAKDCIHQPFKHALYAKFAAHDFYQ